MKAHTTNNIIFGVIDYMYILNIVKMIKSKYIQSVVEELGWIDNTRANNTLSLVLCFHNMFGSLILNDFFTLFVDGILGRGQFTISFAPTGLFYRVVN